MVAFDLETSGTNPLYDEIIEAYFERLDVYDSFHYQARVSRWSEDAAEIHGITKEENDLMPEYKDAFPKLVEWLPRKFIAVIYANPNTQLGRMYYDVAMLKTALMDYLDIDRESDLPYDIVVDSVYDLAKECYDLGVFKPIKNKNNRNSFSQEDVYYALFDKKPDGAHRAISDVSSMLEIRTELLRRKANNEVNSNQLSML